MLIGTLLICLLTLLISQWLVISAAKGRLFSTIESIPKHDVGIILGCAEYLAGGQKNLFFQYRIAAAVDLYHAGKIHYILVSGDNRTTHYNEPIAMTAALQRLGIPPNFIYRDYAGFRTLDTIVRAKKVFGLSSFVIISQPFHNRRALFLARYHSIDAVAFNAHDVPLHHSLKTFLREQLAVIMAVLDVYVLHTEPHFLGEKIVIGVTNQLK